MNRQLDQISGSIYDAVVLDTGQAAVRGLLPQIGQKVRFDDGREFVFCSTFEVEVAAEMVATATFSNAELAVEVAAIGAYEVVLTSAAIAMFGGSAGVLTKDRLAGGYIHMVDDTGEGYQYRIKGNTVGSATADVTITLYDPLKVAIDATTDAIVTGPKYRGVVECSADLPPVGVCMVPTTGASSSVEAFFWVQCGGVATCLGAGTIGVPCATAASGAVAVSAEAGSGDYDTIVGTAVATTSDGHAIVNLNL